MKEFNVSIKPFRLGLKLLIITQLLFVMYNPGSLFCQGKCIEYDHEFEWHVDIMKIKVIVKGFVPFEFAENHLVLGWCPNNKDGSEYFETAASILKGEATLFAKGELHIVDEDESCHMYFEHPIKVILKGKTWWKPNKIGCSDETCNFELNEDWTKPVEWKVRCSDPEQAAMLRMFLPKRLHDEVYTGEDKTLQFANYEGAVLEAEAFQGMHPTMKGKLRYIFHSSSWKGTDWNPHGPQLRYDDSRPKPKDYPKPKGEWGPPLDKIVWKRPGK